MSKLFKLKEWLTVDEAAKHLSSVLGEEVVAADIFRLAIDGGLTLSVHFPDKALGSLGEVVGCEGEERILTSAEMRERLAESGRVKYEEIALTDYIGNDQFIGWSKKITPIDGVWDLLMLADGRPLIESVYQRLVGGAELNPIGFEGIFVKCGDRYCCLVETPNSNPLFPGSNANQHEMKRYIHENDLSQEQIKELHERSEANRKDHLEILNKSPFEKGFYPADRFPKDCVYVVRTSVILDLLHKVEERPAQQEKPLTTKERNSMLTLIAALCAEAKVDYTQRGIATTLAASTEVLGRPLTDDTIRGILKQVKALMD